ncbi:Protein of unknown function [Propionibacterium freudenreichii]|nr:Protein of unknown function [Propionibacterium freudenreichii]CEI33338.1 Protein of unknown function [Propionibacterium freudenreichii]
MAAFRHESACGSIQA